MSLCQFFNTWSKKPKIIFNLTLIHHLDEQLLTKDLFFIFLHKF